MGKALELKGLRKDGSEFPIDVALSPVRVHRKVLVAAAVRDMSDYRKLEEALRQRTLELEEMDRRKDQFLATLAHELRNPLAALSLAGQRLRLPGATDRIQWAADVIERQTAHMLHLVDELLDVARVRQGKVRLRMQPTDLGQVAARAAETSRPLIESRRHAFEFVPSAEPVWVLADATRLSQVIVNLLTNAARYTPEGGRIWLEVTKDDQNAIVCVRDTGVGIPERMRSRIFKMFAQGESSEAVAEPGLGIGLALVDKLVTMHGGTVALSGSEAGAGSEFVVRIPLLRERFH